MPPPARALTPRVPTQPLASQGPCRQLAQGSSGRWEAVFPATAAGLAPVSLLGAPGCECRSHSLWPDVQTWTTGPGCGGGTPEPWEPGQRLRRLAEDPHPEERQPPQGRGPGRGCGGVLGHCCPLAGPTILPAREVHPERP